MAIAADTSCAREYHAGLAAQLGIQAALAAQARFKAELNVLESPRGFFDAFNAFNDHAVAEVSQGLGQSWDIVTDMAIKLMPGAHPFHAIAEATWTAAIEHDVNPETIRRIVISAPQLKVWAHQAIQPHDLIGAAHSVPYFVASSLVDRRFGWDHFSLEKMRDPRIAAMLTRVCFDPDPQPHPDRFPHRHGGTVTLELMNGQVIRSTCQAPRGSGARGIDWVDVDHKYRQLISVANMSSSSIESSLSLIHQLQDQTSLMPLISFFNPQKQA
jgi:2-methylcitrate dehydratase PrpD